MVSLQKQLSLMGRIQWMLAASIVLLVGAFYLCCFGPVTRRTHAVEGQIARCRQELSSNQDQSKVLSAVAAEVERLKGRLSEFKKLPREQEAPQFIKDLSQLAVQASLKRQDWKTVTPVRGERLTKAPIQLTFEGDFVNVFSFLRHVEELQRLTRVPSMNIKAKDKTGQVKVQLTMDVYCAAD